MVWNGGHLRMVWIGSRSGVIRAFSFYLDGANKSWLATTLEPAFERLSRAMSDCRERVGWSGVEPLTNGTDR